jgi:hypothetical protein
MAGVTSRKTPVTSGWLAFAGILGVTVGAFNVIDGLAALLNKRYFLVADDRLLIFNFTAWGWLLLILGILQIAAGVGILAGQHWAREVGIVLAFLAALFQMVFLAAFPVWSVLVIALCVVVIYALTTPPSDAVGI